jgi:hypothetical protein
MEEEVQGGIPVCHGTSEQTQTAGLVKGWTRHGLSDAVTYMSLMEEEEAPRPFVTCIIIYTNCTCVAGRGLLVADGNWQSTPYFKGFVVYLSYLPKDLKFGKRKKQISQIYYNANVIALMNRITEPLRNSMQSFICPEAKLRRR